MYKTTMIATGAMLLVVSAGAQAEQRVTCESTKGREQHCSADTRGGVRLITQFSRSGCYQNETWGYDARGIWVNGGCRAEFETGNPGSSKRSHSNDAAAAAVLVGALIGAAALSEHEHKKDNRGSDHSEYERGYQDGLRGDYDQDKHSQDYKDGYRAAEESGRAHGRSSSGGDSPPRAATQACLDQMETSEATRNSRPRIETTSALQPGYWEVIVATSSGDRFVCNVDNRGRVSEFRGL